MCDRVPCGRAVHGVSHAVSFITAYRLVYGQFVLFDVVIHQSGVFPGDAVFFKLSGKRLMCLVVLCYHQKTAGILVYPVDYPRAYHTVDG